MGTTGALSVPAADAARRGGSGRALKTSEIKLLLSGMMKQFNAWVLFCPRKRRIIKLKMMRELMISPGGIKRIGSLQSAQCILGAEIRLLQS